MSLLRSYEIYCTYTKNLRQYFHVQTEQMRLVRDNYLGHLFVQDSKTRWGSDYILDVIIRHNNFYLCNVYTSGQDEFLERAR